MGFSSFTGANFTGFLGGTFRFQTLDAAGIPSGPVQKGHVKRIFRQGRNTVVEMLMLELHCIHIYPARDIYLMGYARGGGDDST